MGHPHRPKEIVFGGKSQHFRIPALLYVDKWKKFLAFAERRTCCNKDESAKNLVMRTGTRQSDGEVKWSPIKDLMKATKDKYRTMNPCPVFETDTRTLFLFFICIKDKIKEGDLEPGQTCLCFVSTTDGGETWSNLKDVTDDLVVADKKLSEYKTFAVGPGHGLEVRTSDFTRLLIPAYVKISNEESHSLVLYSDNGGESWQAGQQLSKKTCECQVAKIQGGELYCNARNDGCYRIEALSYNTEASFIILPSPSLKETPHGCQGSVLSFPDPNSSNMWLFFSHPTEGPKSCCESKWTRRDLGIYLRKSLQGPWSKPFIIHPGISGYSDLAQCEEEHRFACLLECGKFCQLKIVFKEFTLGEVLNPGQVVSGSSCSPCCICGSCCLL
ncbi:sialidase-3-like [Sardina pilchardus]|uniref:sialidase-3-like n=1 Tax=Sardina pilchardus TaxID=27697 RepID=UPI002E1547BA